MASIKDIPVSKIREVLDSGKDLIKTRDEVIRVAIFIDPSTPGDLISSIKDAFTPQLPTGRIHVEMMSSQAAPSINTGTDVAIVLTGGSDEMVSSCARALAMAGIPVAIVAESSLDAPEIDADGATASIALVAASNKDALLDKLARWIIDTTDKDLAFAANYPFVRRPKAEKIISSCAGQNAAVGAIPILPGADMPIMTANQAKMALEIAAIYGQDVSPERVPELLGVVGGGFVLRTAAREAVGLVPGVGWALKGGIGYAGTVAMGNALIARFEIAEDPEAMRQAAGTVADKASTIASDISSKVTSFASDAARQASSTASSASAEGKKRAREIYEYVTIKPKGTDQGPRA